MEGGSGGSNKHALLVARNLALPNLLIVRSIVFGPCHWAVLYERGHGTPALFCVGGALLFVGGASPADRPLA